jgi:DNA-binding PadR family transcriptional regulator
MRGGNLQHIILHKLSERPLSGYALCKAIEQTSGYKPSFGSIYPLLESLASQKLVTARQEGRSKVYTLTAAGREQAKIGRAQYAQQVDRIIEETRIFCDITGQDPEPMLQLFARFKEGENPFGPVSAQALALRNTLFAAAFEGKLKRNPKEAAKILNDAITKLKRLK